MEDTLTKTMKFKCFKCAECGTELGAIYSDQYKYTTKYCINCGEPMDEGDEVTKDKLYLGMNTDDVEEIVEDENC
jgi:peptide methionine sulfoxide reductase MsrB